MTNNNNLIDMDRLKKLMIGLTDFFRDEDLNPLEMKIVLEQYKEIVDDLLNRKLDEAVKETIIQAIKDQLKKK